MARVVSVIAAASALLQLDSKFFSLDFFVLIITEVSFFISNDFTAIALRFSHTAA